MVLLRSAGEVGGQQVKRRGKGVSGSSMYEGLGAGGSMIYSSNGQKVRRGVGEYAFIWGEVGGD